MFSIFGLKKDWRAIAQELLQEPYVYSAPALRFEQETGLTAIHVPWAMPNGRAHALVEEELCAETLVLIKSAEHGPRHADKIAYSRVLAFFDAVLALNPGLKGLLHFRNDPTKLSHMVYGITSQFNLQDIVHFLLVEPEEYAANPALTWGLRAIERRANTQLYWKASPRTVNRIWQQMEYHPNYRRSA